MNLLLFLLSAFIWGSAWYPIKLQIGPISPLWSLAYRFIISGIILVTYCLITNCSLSFNRKQHFWIFIQAFFLCFINYILFYLAMNYFVSGIVATLSASIIIMNVFNSRIFLKTPIELKSVIGGIIGIIGLCFMIFNEFVSLHDKSFWFIFNGLLITLGATLSVSLGQIVFIANLKRGLPIIQINALGFVYGSILLAITAFILKQMPAFDPSPSYVWSLGYLSLVGTVFGFLVYFILAKRIGLDKSAYVFVLAPVLAMAFSSFLEKLIWTPSIIMGVSLVLIGNVIVMTKKLPSWKFWNPEKIQNK